MPPPYAVNHHLRYEIIGTNPSKQKLEAMKMQKERIAGDEANTAKLKVLKEENKTNLIAEWSTKLELKTAYKMNLNQEKKIKGELELKNASLLAIRQKAMKILLEREALEYEKELLKLDKTFYQQRI